MLRQDQLSHYGKFVILVLVACVLQPSRGEVIVLDSHKHLDALKTNMGIVMYGHGHTHEYAVFTEVSQLPEFSHLEFYYIPSYKLQLPRHDPSLFIYRSNKKAQQQQFEQTSYTFENVRQWIEESCIDKLKEYTPEDIDGLFMEDQSGFIVLDFGQLSITRSKILVANYSQNRGFKHGKVTLNNPSIKTVVQLLGVHNQAGVPKLAFWNAQTKRVYLYRKQLHKITEAEIAELVQRGTEQPAEEDM